MYGLISINDISYQNLADITWNKNKISYAEKHGYRVFNKVYDRFVPTIGWDRLQYVYDTLLDNPDIEWIWLTGTDSLITNTNIKIEDKIDNNYHFIASVDFNTLNADSLLFRNTVEGRSFIKSVLSRRESLQQDPWHENAAIIYELNVPRECAGIWQPEPYYGMHEKYHNVAKIMPQKYMNSYDYSIYYWCFPHSTSNLDKVGQYGNWEKGDWLIHWPATSLEHRMQLANYYMTMVI